MHTCLDEATNSTSHSITWETQLRKDESPNTCVEHMGFEDSNDVPKNTIKFLLHSKPSKLTICLHILVVDGK